MHDELVARLLQVACHAGTHHAEPDKSDLHRCSSRECRAQSDPCWLSAQAAAALLHARRCSSTTKCAASGVSVCHRALQIDQACKCQLREPGDADRQMRDGAVRGGSLIEHSVQDHAGQPRQVACPSRKALQRSVIPNLARKQRDQLDTRHLSQFSHSGVWFTNGAGNSADERPQINIACRHFRRGMCMLSVDVAVEPQDWEAVDTHVPRSYIHRRRRDDMVLHVMAQAGKPADQGTMHVKPVPTELGQSYVLSPSHQTYGGDHSTLVHLCIRISATN